MKFKLIFFISSVKSPLWQAIEKHRGSSLILTEDKIVIVTLESELLSE